MEKVLLNFNLFLIFVYFVRITRHGLHILQLENYYISRYAKCIREYFFLFGEGIISSLT